MGKVKMVSEEKQQAEYQPGDYRCLPSSPQQPPSLGDVDFNFRCVTSGASTGLTPVCAITMNQRSTHQAFTCTQLAGTRPDLFHRYLSHLPNY